MITEGQIVVAASTAVVQAMANDTYHGARDWIARFFRRHSAEPDKTMAQFDDYHQMMALGVSDHNAALQTALVSVVRRELAAVVQGDAGAVESLRLLTDELDRLSSDRGAMVVRGDVVVKNNKAKGDQYNAGRDNVVRVRKGAL